MVDPAELKTNHIFEINALVGQYSFRIAELPEVEIRVKVWCTDVSHGGDRYMYEVSHYIQPPTQAGPYTTSAPYAASEQGTIEKAIRDILTFYTGAIQQGHKPSPKWFIPDEDFK